MKSNLKRILVAGSLMLALATSNTIRADDNPPGFVDFGTFSGKEAGKEFVEVNISSNVIGLAAQFAKEEPEVLDLLKGLKAIRVNVLKLTEENREAVKARIAKVREALKEQKWETLVTAHQDKHDVNVAVKTKGSETIEGVVVTVMEGENQAVLVNIVGDINPEKISTLGQRFNIDPLKQIVPKKEKKA